MIRLPFIPVAPTDSDLHRRWIELNARIQQVEKGEAETLQPQLDLLNAEWQVQLARRKRGELTVVSRLDAVVKIVRSITAIHGFPIRLFAEEYQPERDITLGEEWILIVMYEGKTEEFYEETFDQFNKVLDRCNDELQQLPFVSLPVRDMSRCNVGPREWRYDDAELPEGYFDKNENEDEEDDYLRYCGHWLIHTIVWAGPEVKRSSRKTRRFRGG